MKNIALVCMGSRCQNAQLPAKTKTYMENHYPCRVYYNYHTYQFTTPQERANILLNYLQDDEIDLIWALRGGEGSADIIPYLHNRKELLTTLAKKSIIGYSDFTAVLLYFSQYYNWSCIHGPSPLQFVKNMLDEETEKNIIQWQQGLLQTSVLTRLQPMNKIAHEVIQGNQVIEGELTGGCLSLLDISINDIWEINTDGKIVFIEDVNEKAHKIHRTLKYLQRLDKFKDIKALVYGDFLCNAIGCDEESQKQNADYLWQTMQDFAKTLSCPVYHTIEFGHGRKNCLLPYNKLAKLTKQTLSVAAI